MPGERSCAWPFVGRVNRRDYRAKVKPEGGIIKSWGPVIGKRREHPNGLGRDEDTEGTEHSQGTRSVFDLCVFDPALNGNVGLGGLPRGVPQGTTRRPAGKFRPRQISSRGPSVRGVTGGIWGT